MERRARVTYPTGTVALRCRGCGRPIALVHHATRQLWHSCKARGDEGIHVRGEAVVKCRCGTETEAFQQRA